MDSTDESVEYDKRPSFPCYPRPKHSLSILGKAMVQSHVVLDTPSCE